MTIQEAMAIDPTIDRELLVEDARAWLLDCLDDDDFIEGLNSTDVLVLVQRNYQGGLAQFIVDGY